MKGDINLIHQEWPDVSVKAHKEMKRLKTQKQRDHMSETELIFTALAELSTRQIAGERRLRKWHSTRRGEGNVRKETLHRVRRHTERLENRQFQKISGVLGLLKWFQALLGTLNC